MREYREKVSNDLLLSRLRSRCRKLGTYDVDNLLNSETKLDGQRFGFVENWSFQFVVGSDDEQVVQQAALHRPLVTNCLNKQTFNIFYRPL